MKEQILQLRAEGKSYRQIQKQLGCSRGTISYHCNSETKRKVIENQTRRRAGKPRREIDPVWIEERALLQYQPKETRLQALSRWYNDLKSQSKCKSCSENHIACLEFHHIDSKTKLFEISAFRFYALPEVLEELEKCEVLCANCHRKLHYQEFTALKASES